MINTVTHEDCLEVMKDIPDTLPEFESDEVDSGLQVIKWKVLNLLDSSILTIKQQIK